jgi:flagella basal body P-ring formation protein FlgA
MRLALLLLPLMTLLAAPAMAAELDRESAREAIAAEARRNLPDTVVEIEIYDINLRGTLDVPQGDRVRVRGEGDEDWIGRVALVLSADGEQIRVTAEVAAYMEVAVLRRPVPRGETITLEDLGAARRDVSALPKDMVTEPARLLGRVARRDLGLNQVVKDADLQDRVDAQRNQPITVLIHSGALKITGAGVLRAEARVGDLVEATLVSSGTLVRGILITPDVVEVPTADASAVTAARQP